ncbi:glycosyltransferase family 2 protein [Campylobacter concisus]|uniref:glycosyltransferase family 2 protein n=1 Tax=Campylobacter concisus TaxID=199 RepID=UPI001652BCE3|nr:glycosyltransferase family A protein [Campylobacter concisus]
MPDVKISFVVPVFNKKEHIRDCLNSLISQDMDDIEIIVINDGSTDNTLEILEEYKDKIILKTKSNAGVSAARNDGILLASGKYTICVDADDYVEKDYASCVYDIAEKFDADIVITDMCKVYDYKKLFLKDFETKEDGVIYKNEYLKKLLASRHNKVLHNAANKAIRTEILKENLFPVGITQAEDFHAVVRNVIASKTLVKLNKAFYCYKIGNNNTAGFEKLKAVMDHKFVYDDIISILKNKNLALEMVPDLELRKIKSVYMPAISARPNLNNSSYVKALDLFYEDIDSIINSSGFSKLRLKQRILLKVLKNIKSYENVSKILKIFNTINGFLSNKKMKEFKE